MASPISLSWQAYAIKAVLKALRRRRIYTSVNGLHAGIASTRRTGPAHPTHAMRQQLSIDTRRVGRCTVHTLQPRGRTADRVVFYVHGGAYCRPITRHHWSFLQWLAAEEGCTIVVPLYPLAPESQCPDTVRELVGVYEWAQASHPRMDALMGDSAGGGLCLALCQTIREGRGVLPGRVSLITPWVDATLTHREIEGTARRDPMLGIHGLREAGRLYAGPLDPGHPLVSPLTADLQGLPPLQVLAATDDLLHHDALVFVDKARAAGCHVELHVAAGMVHVWPLLPIPEAMDARRAIGKFLRA